MSDKKVCVILFLLPKFSQLVIPADVENETTIFKFVPFSEQREKLLIQMLDAGNMVLRANEHGQPVDYANQIYTVSSEVVDLIKDAPLRFENDKHKVLFLRKSKLTSQTEFDVSDLNAGVKVYVALNGVHSAFFMHVAAELVARFHKKCACALAGTNVFDINSGDIIFNPLA